MSEIKLKPEEKEKIISQLQNYCEEQLDLHLEQFDAEFFADFIIEQVGPVFFNAGVEAAIKAYQSYSEQIQEHMDLQRVL